MTLDELLQRCREAGISVTIAGLIRARDVARLLDVSERTLHRWRDEETGPEAQRIGGTWFYALDAVSGFVYSREPDPLPARRRRLHCRHRPPEPCSLRRRSIA